MLAAGLVVVAIDFVRARWPGPRRASPARSPGPAAARDGRRRGRRRWPRRRSPSAAAGDAVEEDRRGVAAGDGGEHEVKGVGLGGGERRPGGGGRRATGPAIRQRPAGPFPDLGADEPRRTSPARDAAPNRSARAAAATPAVPSIGAAAGSVRQRREGLVLPRTQRPPQGACPRPRRRRRLGALAREPEPALVPRTGRGAHERPTEIHEPLVGQRAQPPQERAASLGRREVAVRGATARPPRPAGRRRRARAPARRGPASPPRRGHLHDQLEALQEPRRHHRAHDRGHGRQVATRAPRRTRAPAAVAAGRRSARARRSDALPGSRARDRRGIDPADAMTIPSACRAPLPNGTRTASPGSRSARWPTAYVHVRGPGPAGASTATSTRRPGGARLSAASASISPGSGSNSTDVAR